MAAHLTLISKIWLMIFQSPLDFKSSVSRSETTGDCATIFENKGNHWEKSSNGFITLFYNQTVWIRGFSHFPTQKLIFEAERAKTTA
jgi:hypothetical protein